MHIYLGGLWQGISRSELELLVRNKLRAPWYLLRAARGQLIGCEIFEMIERQTGKMEYCAVLQVQPSRLSWEFVSKVNRAVARGRQLHAHRWFKREGAGDRRIGGTSSPVASVERRETLDRRRRLKVRNLAKSFSVQAVSGFERSHGA